MDEMCKSSTVVLYPCTVLRSHLVPIVELAKLILTHDDHHPTPLSIAIIISAAPNETSGSTANYIAAVSAAVPSISFHHLPAVSFPHIKPPVCFFEFARSNNPSFHQTLLHISKSSTIKALVLDFFCDAAFEVAENLNVPTYYFGPSSATTLAADLYFPFLHQTISESLKDLDTYFIDIPGLPRIHAKDLPSDMQDRTSPSYRYFLEMSKNMARSAGVIKNSTEVLDVRAIKAITNGECVANGPTPPVYCVGPLVVANTDQVSVVGDESSNECLSWLDSQPSRSVLYVSFGSLGLVKTKELKEIALGLERSGVRFLWVVRNPPPHPVDADVSTFLPDGFLDRTKERGLVKSWAPQVAVLNHNSVGGFLCHGGWNSVLEGVLAGLPMALWPLHAENGINTVVAVEELKIGFRVEECKDNENEALISASEVEKRVRELMEESEEGREVRERALILKNKVNAAFSEDGASRIALTKLIQTWKQT